MMYNNPDIKAITYHPDQCEDMLIVNIEFYSSQKDTVLIFPLADWKESDTMIIIKVGQYIKENINEKA